MIGLTIGHYRVLEELGAGGMGIVYRAEDVRLGRAVALKFLPEHLACDHDSLQRFQREARAASALNHPHICTIHDIDEVEGRPFIVMELLEGESLRTRLSRMRITVPAVVDAVIQLADALESAHEKGIIHRDIKPENIFVTSRGAAKLLDFGIAKLVTEHAAATMRTATRADTGPAILGTVAYMSPEQVRGEMLDARTDLFSLGVVLYEMVTGAQPFRGVTSGAIIGEILTKAPVAPVSLNRDVPSELERIVNKLLEKDRDLRYPSARDVRVDLERLRRSFSAPRLITPPPVGEVSIVVLPFENLSPDPDTEFFADALTEEIIMDLSKLRALRVISRNSAMQLRKTTKDTRTIGRELNVRFLLEGSVRRAGNQLRIAAQLIETEADSHLWAEKYTGTLDDVFDIQEKLSRAIVDALKVRLTADEERLIAARNLPHARAFDLYLRAHEALYSVTPAELERAESLTHEAIAITGPNAWLYALLGHLQFQAFDMGVRHDPGEAGAWSDRAMELSAYCPRAFLVKALLAHMVGDMVPAIRQGRRAAELAAGGDVLAWLAYFEIQAGRVEDAREAADRSLACDPLSWMARWAGAATAMMSGDLQGAVHRMRASLQVGSEQACIRFWLAICLAYIDRMDEALSVYFEITRWGGVMAEMYPVFAAVARHDREAFDRALASGALLEAARDHKELAWWMADAYAWIGDNEAAFQFLERAIDLGIWNCRFWSEVDPAFSPLRSDPRFAALMARAKEKENTFHIQA